LVASRCKIERFLRGLVNLTACFFAVYRPNLRAKSDADILRDAKLEAMGLPPQDDSTHSHHRSNHERTQMATDEMVCLTSSSQGHPGTDNSVGDGTVQETYAKVVFGEPQLYSTVYAPSTLLLLITCHCLKYILHRFRVKL
jgi:hypothetical protein